MVRLHMSTRKEEYRLRRSSGWSHLSHRDTFIFPAGVVFSRLTPPTSTYWMDRHLPKHLRGILEWRIWKQHHGRRKPRAEGRAPVKELVSITPVELQGALKLFWQLAVARHLTKKNIIAPSRYALSDAHRKMAAWLLIHPREHCAHLIVWPKHCF